MFSRIWQLLLLSLLVLFIFLSILLFCRQVHFGLLSIRGYYCRLCFCQRLLRAYLQESSARCDYTPVVNLILGMLGERMIQQRYAFALQEKPSVCFFTCQPPPYKRTRANSLRSSENVPCDAEHNEAFIYGVRAWDCDVTLPAAAVCLSGSSRLTIWLFGKEGRKDEGKKGWVYILCVREWVCVFVFESVGVRKKRGVGHCLKIQTSQWKRMWWKHEDRRRWIGRGQCCKVNPIESLVHFSAAFNVHYRWKKRYLKSATEAQECEDEERKSRLISKAAQC